MLEINHFSFFFAILSRCQVKLVGDMMVSFPAGIVQVLANNPSPAALSFRIKNIGKMSNVIPNKQLISRLVAFFFICHLTLNHDHLRRRSPFFFPCSETFNTDECLYEFNMSALSALLRRQSEQAPSASYYNVDILKYQVKAMPGARSTPLQLVSYWKCDQNNTDLRIDYKYNPVALNGVKPLSNLCISVPVDGGVTHMQSKPSGSWYATIFFFGV